jgi:hypothetical protein
MAEANEADRITYTQLFLHRHIDLDVGAAAVLAKRFEQVAFPGLGSAKTSFHGKLPMSLKEMKEKGGIALDFGWQDLSQEEREDPEAKKHIIDHHGTSVDKSTTHLVAERVGIADDPIYQPLVDYIDMEDLEGPHAVSSTFLELGYVPPEILERVRLLERFSLAGLIGILRDKMKDPGILSFIGDIVNGYIEGQLRFWKDVAEEYERKAQIIEFENGKRRLKVAIIETDVAGVASFSRTKQGGHCSAIVQRQSSGNIQIIANQWMRPPIDLQEWAKIIRVLEMKRRDIKDEYELSSLAFEGKLDICPFWWTVRNPKNKAVWMVANGSPKHEVEPTVLPLELIRDTGPWALDERILSPQCPRTHCLYDQCGFYPFGLTRCERIRVVEGGEQA